MKEMASERQAHASSEGGTATNRESVLQKRWKNSNTNSRVHICTCMLHVYPAVHCHLTIYNLTLFIREGGREGGRALTC